MMMTMDAYDLWEKRDEEQEGWLEQRPVCTCCGEHIQEDSVVVIMGSYYCDRCLDDMRVYI